MIVIPAIDLKDGKCVRLFKGDYSKVTVFDDEPAEAAKRWESQGAKYLHLVDLDGAAAGKPQNMTAVFEILSAVGIPCELGGGLRHIDSMATILEVGIDRIIVGTAALEQPHILAEACKYWPKRIVAGIDARDGLVATRGWKTTSDKLATELAKELAALGVARIIYTDIDRDGTLTQPNYKATEEMVKAVSIPVIASGGVARAEHIAQLRDTGVEGVIVGRALYEGTLTLSDALAAAEGRPIA